MNSIQSYTNSDLDTYLSNRGAVIESVSSTPWPLKPSGDAGRKKDETQAVVANANAANWRMPEVVIYEHINFGGAEKRTNLNFAYVGDFWNDRISSIIVVSGTWRFYQHANFQGSYWDLPQGWYSWVEAARIPNDMISSFKVIAY